MKHFLRLFGFCLLFGCAPAVWAQAAGPKIERVNVKYVGPATVSEQFIRSNIRVKPGDIYRPNVTTEDIDALYATGQFYNIRVAADQAEDGGVAVTYIVQVKPRLTDIKLEGNKKLKDSKIRKKITAKVGQPLDEQKLFADTQEILKLYQKSGYYATKVKYVVNIDENAGRGTATFQITESPKVKITQIQFVGAAAFKQKELRKQLKTKRRWMFSWLTGSNTFKDDQFLDDREQLIEFYRNHGYLDFEIKDVKFEHPQPNKMVIRFYVYEGRQYRVGSVKFTGNELYHGPEFRAGLVRFHKFEHYKGDPGTNGLPMDVGSVFTPDGLSKDITVVEDFYGSKGHIDMSQQAGTLRVLRIPNVDTGTMDVEFQIDEGQKSYVERIDIHGNTKTKDKVIRRELALSPGEVFDMTRVKVSQQRLDGLQYFEKADLRPEPTEPPIAGRKNLAVNVEEKNTGNLSAGAGFSSVDALVGFAELSQGNFDLFHPPTFTGGGQKFRLRVQLGTKRQDYQADFTEPWFLNRKLALGVSLYHHELDFLSLHGEYNEDTTGMKLSLTRALWSDFLIGSISYNVENLGIHLNPGWHGDETIPAPYYPYGPIPVVANVPDAILAETGYHLLSRFGASLAYDTRNSVKLPNHGQRTELSTEFVEGDRTYYKVDLISGWYFPGLFRGHVLEIGGRAGSARSLSSGDVPFYDRYYLGGLDSLRGFRYRSVSPRQSGFDEPIGGDSYWFSYSEYSIPIIEKDNGVAIRFAGFYDAGSVGNEAYSFSGNFDDNWGLGLRINIPKLGPLRFDYGVPIHHDKYNSGGGQFQFGAGYYREF